MTEDGASRLLGRAGLWVCLGALSMAVLLAWPLVAWWGYSRHGLTGLSAAAVAAAVCWLGATIALVITHFSRGPEGAMLGLFGAMFCRMGLPLLVGLMLNSSGGPLAEAGVFGMVLIFYLITLAVETPLSVHLVRSRDKDKLSKAA